MMCWGLKDVPGDPLNVAHGKEREGESEGERCKQPRKGGSGQTTNHPRLRTTGGAVRCTAMRAAVSGSVAQTQAAMRP